MAPDPSSRPSPLAYEAPAGELGVRAEHGPSGPVLVLPPSPLWIDLPFVLASAVVVLVTGAMACILILGWPPAEPSADKRHRLIAICLLVMLAFTLGGVHTAGDVVRHLKGKPRRRRVPLRVSTSGDRPGEEVVSVRRLGLPVIVRPTWGIRVLTGRSRLPISYPVSHDRRHAEAVAADLRRILSESAHCAGK